ARRARRAVLGADRRRVLPRDEARVGARLRVSRWRDLGRSRVTDRLRVALVGGPMYDSLYAPFLDDVDVVVHEDHPTLNRRVAEGAIATICALARGAPADLADWHYDQVDAALLDGRVDCAAAWPGGCDAIRASALYEHLRPAIYPGGVSYSGCHAWAIPTTCG